MLEKILYLSLMLLAFIPFNQLIFVRLGSIMFGAYELLYIFILLLLAGLMMFRGVRQSGVRLLILWLSISVLYIMFSPYLNGSSFYDAFDQLRFFLPFYVATFLLATPINGNLENILMKIAYAIGAGSLVALLTYFFFPGFLETSLSANQEAVEIATIFGRLYWINFLLCFLLLAHYLATKNRSFFLYSTIIVSLFGLLLTQNRTVIIILPLYYIIASFYRERKLAKPFLSLSFFSITTIFLIVIFADERFYNLFQLRFLGKGDIGNVYNDAFVLGRFEIYKQYWQIIYRTLPFGQGLGLPFFNGLTGIYTTDISLMSFVLPFGFFGLIVFALFIRNVWHASKTSTIKNDYEERFSSVFSVMLIFLFLVSFNIDVFSRNNAVVFIAFVASILIGRGDTQRKKSLSVQSIQC